MGEVINLDAVRLERDGVSKNEKERVELVELTANFHEPVYHQVDKVEFGVRTQVLSDALTRHAKNIDALKPSQKIIVDEIKVNENISFVKADIIEAGSN